MLGKLIFGLGLIFLFAFWLGGGYGSLALGFVCLALGFLGAMGGGYTGRR
ncbi:MAG TPA: hypothetical protein VER55_15925 [Ardenticatenaceae bacterium]|nr:hypothetical protein [Ardenticatenaceae bacterium]